MNFSLLKQLMKIAPNSLKYATKSDVKLYRDTNLMPDKFEIANALRETGILLSIQGQNQYKARAYMNGALTIESLSESVDKLIEEDRLTELPGIGPSLAASIQEIYSLGESKLLRHLRKELPPGVIELSRVPGMTLKRIQALHKDLGIESLEELEQACLEGRVRKVKGFGQKTEQTILSGIRSYRENKQRILLLDALEISEQLLHHIKNLTKVESIEIAGAIRRWEEVIDEIEIVVASQDAEPIFAALESFPLNTRIEARDHSSMRVRLTYGITATCYVTDSFATRLIERTALPAHFERLQELAAKQNLVLMPDQFQKGNKRIQVRGEDDVYKQIGLHPVPPELRVGLNELEEAEKAGFDDLIELENIKGMTHCHTTFSDGRYSVLDMARAAEKMGMSYLTITDHSPSAHYAGGLDKRRLQEQWREIEKAQEQVGIRLLKGTECDILADGALDYPDDVLERFDVIIASVHSRFKLDYDQMTERLLRCMKIPLFKIWGHPLGRLVLRREPINCDVERILEAMASAPAAIEINSDPYRLDIEPKWARLAKEKGIKFIISTDAHSIRDYENLPFGVHLARRAGIRRQDVLNTWNVERFADFVRPAG